LLSTVQVGITVISTLTGVFGGAGIAALIAPFVARVLPYVGRSSRYHIVGDCWCSDCRIYRWSLGS
jgi:CBS domain containing-hemolysin-like protein